MSELTNTGGTLADEARVACKKFLSSVLFVDDEIKMGEKTGNGLSAANITDAFAAESIVPSFYSCNHENQYGKILALIRKTDVFVLDWKMPVKRTNAEENPDADAGWFHPYAQLHSIRSLSRNPDKRIHSRVQKISLNPFP